MAGIDTLLEQAGKLPLSPPARLYSHSQFAYATNIVYIIPAGTLVCHQAALVYATGLSLAELGARVSSDVTSTSSCTLV